MSTLDDSHKLAQGDKLSFRIVEDQEDPKEPMEPRPLIVSDHGDVEVPYIGRFPASGKTCKHLAAEIKTELEKEYYYQATVIIGLDLLSKSTGKVYVVGEVRLTGPVDMPGDETLTVGKAILRAGGFTNYADKRGVKVTRAQSSTKGPRTANAQSKEVSCQWSVVSSPSSPTTFVVNVSDVLEKGKADRDLALEPGDVIYVPTRLINF
jgi:protein involved in polysaccharide export with SLBB domain